MHGDSFSVSVTDKMIAEHKRMASALPLKYDKLRKYSSR